LRAGKCFGFGKKRSSQKKTKHKKKKRKKKKTRKKEPAVEKWKKTWLPDSLLEQKKRDQKRKTHQGHDHRRAKKKFPRIGNGLSTELKSPRITRPGLMKKGERA